MLTSIHTEDIKQINESKRFVVLMLEGINIQINNDLYLCVPGRKNRGSGVPRERLEHGFEARFWPAQEKHGLNGQAYIA